VPDFDFLVGNTIILALRRKNDCGVGCGSFGLTDSKSASTINHFALSGKSINNAKQKTHRCDFSADDG
jgi:hypothetical protein